MYIKPTKVRQRLNEKGKKVSKSFLLWLDAKVERIIDRQATALGHHVIITAQDAEALDAFSGGRNK